MFCPEGQRRVHFCGQPVDMRKSFDGLYALTRHDLQQDPRSGHRFGFINRRATQINGALLGPHWLEAGRCFSDWRSVGRREMDWTRLKLLLEGIEPGRLRKRYRRPVNFQE